MNLFFPEFDLDLDILDERELNERARIRRLIEERLLALEPDLWPSEKVVSDTLKALLKEIG